MVYDKERFFAVIHFVTVNFSNYLLNQEFTLRTDHSSLRCLDSFHDKATDMPDGCIIWNLSTHT